MQEKFMLDVKITIYNDTNEFQNIIIFQLQDDLNLMLNNSNNHFFPVAWQVFPLAGKEEGIERYGTTVYTSTCQIGVTYTLDHIVRSNSLPLIQGQLTVKRDAMDGDQLAYFIDERGIQYIEKSEKNADKRITCINNSSFLTSIDIYKNNAKLATWKNIAKGDMAIFNPASKIHLMYNETIKKGQIIEKYMINENQFKGLS